MIAYTIPNPNATSSGNITIYHDASTGEGGDYADASNDSGWDIITILADMRAEIEENQRQEKCWRENQRRAQLAYAAHSQRARCPVPRWQHGHRPGRDRRRYAWENMARR